ncbi:RdgB/HAM1 family non-canonical purine NTP pyrophosphatase [Crateriforma conspicua]|uniref:dITP/XTP pyrophosphatase n=1 Tax=Crateriforma conspicua TaxID=2527996 RepID=A0A5C5Y9W6_9PLAN|nr:RdgB/HAM1 family non-canonical purine NTP pyrophosphatase [Crateriforma conspicua]TWT71718.1 Non-canonical purine NTP pyrophosphatase [Crateriforma conspicua]
MFELVLGTGNQKKLVEIQRMMPADRVRLKTLADFSDPIDVVEDGTTFAENAAKKACQQAKHLGVWVLGEDSGLSVDALDGAPGVFSARYAGPAQDDEANLNQLLDALQGVPPERRSAHYTSSFCLSDPDGAVRLTAEGICRGRIITERHGQGGFGYDPIFQLREYHQTFGQLDWVVKQALSHRSRALRQFLPRFLRLIDSDGVA